MSIPPRLAVRFNEVLGIDAAEDLVSWMDEMRADHAELRHDVRALRGDVVALAQAMNDGFADLKRRADAQDQKFDKLVERFDKLQESMTSVNVRVEGLRGSFIAWHAAFWLTAIVAIVGMLRFLVHAG